MDCMITTAGNASPLNPHNIRNEIMKLSRNIKMTWILSVLLFVAGICVESDAATAASVVIFVVLSVTVEILEAISATNHMTERE
jgi:anaerobic C4-dicarboxylate transporter